MVRMRHGKSKIRKSAYLELKLPGDNNMGHSKKNSRHTKFSDFCVSQETNFSKMALKCRKKEYNRFKNKDIQLYMN